MFTEISTFLSGLGLSSIVAGYVLATVVPFPVVSTWIGGLWSKLAFFGIVDSVASTVATHVVTKQAAVAAVTPAAPAPAATTTTAS